MSARICAVVITRDRLGFLQECIAALRSQTRVPDGILVVDNDSQAETREWLEAQSDVLTVRQANLGCAGGFATGLELAAARGYDWMWCFDDDAHPTPRALEGLVRAMAARPEIRVFNSLCVAAQDPARFQAGALCIRTNADNFLQGQNIYRVADARDYADENGLADTAGGQLYLGTLIHRRVVQTAGVPLEWLFWRGDEVEYSLRMMRAGFHIYSVLDSIVTHPLTAVAFLSLWGKKFPYERMSAVKRYYTIRNSIYIRRVYYANRPFWLFLARRIAAAVCVELIADRRRSWRDKAEGCRAALRGTRDGLAIARGLDPNALQAPGKIHCNDAA